MKGNTVIMAVAKLIAETPCKAGISNWRILAAMPHATISGLNRLRDLARMFRCINSNGIYAYFYSHNRYFPTRAFKDFCRNYVRKYS